MMRDEYDFTEAVKNPYAEELRRQVTMKLDGYIIDYFKAEAARTGLPYQRLINMYLAECVAQERHLTFA